MGKAEAEEPAPRDGRALLSAGALLLAVAAVFVLGAVLHRQVPVVVPQPADVVVAPAPAAEEDPPIPARAEADLRRASERPGAWTLQLVVACQEEGVQRLLDAVPGDDRLYVLPREVSGRACWAVTWDTFSSEADAESATPPASLRLSEAPRPRALAAFAP
jgi:septal ring-binding cell division protein DamX